MMRQSSGIALVSALIFMFILVILASIATINSISNQRNAADTLRTSQAQFAAEAGLDDAVTRIWHRLRVTVPGEEWNITRYNRLLVEKLSLQNESSPPVQSPSPIVLEDGSRYTYRIVRLAAQGGDIVGGAWRAIRLRISATGTLPDGKTTRILQQDIVVQPGFFPFDYALLTNKAECVFCHIDVKSFDAFKGAPQASDPNTWWKRTKVGVLESLIMRDDEDAGTIHGSLLTRGDVYRQKDGQAGVSDKIRTSITLNQNKISDTTPKTITGEYQADCANASPQNPLNCGGVRAVYLNYPKGKWPDGELPSDFPLPVEDANRNRQIDDTEWKAALDESVGGKSDSYPSGRIVSATMQVLPSPPGGLSWGGSSRVNVSSPDLGSSVNDVILDGSSTPIHIDGTVFINGDVIIRGQIKGNGTILARGNVYVLGDLTYVCGEDNHPCTDEEFADPEASKLPAVSLLAGGNIMIGDYLTVSTLFDRELKLLDPGNIQDTFTGCIADSKDPSRCGPPESPNLTLAQMANLNRDELWRALQNPQHVPRFYQYAGDQAYFTRGARGQATSGCEHNSQAYSKYAPITSGEEVASCRGDQVLAKRTLPDPLPANIANAVRVEINPKRLPYKSLKDLWIESVSGRPTRPLRTDGLLYSANAIFAILQHDNPGAVAQGQWEVRGAIIAPDTGILESTNHLTQIRPCDYV